MKKSQQHTPFPSRAMVYMCGHEGGGGIEADGKGFWGCCSPIQSKYGIYPSALHEKGRSEDTIVALNGK